MARETIDFGIDLGTTNSAIAIATGADATVVRNNLQREFTPSAVYVNRSNKVLVGDAARQRVEADAENSCAEFKLKMGVRGQHKVFEASGRSMTPEDLSAEVLKSLRGDVQKLTGEAISAAVITVPAAFELDQCDATRHAASLAGLEFAPLIQEPTAAAWAYSARGAEQRAFWLVYDFGGGTFDAAVVNVQDGEFTVVNHAGNNFLGGKLIDWALVENYLIPAAKREHGLASLNRDNRRMAGAIGKLKIAAENAKIQLSQTETADIEVELDDADGGRFNFEYELRRADVERVSEQFYVRSIGLCRQALAEKGLGPSDIERVLLVGGATLAPALRERLADPREGLGIPLDYSLDSITVVACGAAIFAGTQRPPRRPTPIRPGKVSLDLQHRPVGSDAEPLVGGRARATETRDWTGSTIEFVNGQARPTYHSGKVALTVEGTFTTRLRAEERTTSTYTIELRDQRGTLLETDPTALTYRHAPLVGGDSVLSHSIGVGLEANKVLWLLKKGTELPASKRVVLHSVMDVRRSERTGLIRVPIVEGERPRADRNTLIGRLDIRPEEAKRDVPAGSEVEIFIQIDQSFTPRADAFVPVLDEEFEIQVELGRAEAPDLATLQRATEEVADRYAQLRERVGVRAPEAVELLDRFHSDGVLDEIQRLVTTAQVDPDAAPTCQARLRDAQTALDEVEEALKLPENINDAEALLESVRPMVEEWGDPADRQDLQAAEVAIDAAVKARDRTVLQRQIEVVHAIGIRLLRQSGQLDAVIFGAREKRLADNPNPQVQQLLAEGRDAVAAGDGGRLGAVNAQLDQFVPDDEAISDAIDVMSTVRAGHHR